MSARMLAAAVLVLGAAGCVSAGAGPAPQKAEPKPPPPEAILARVAVAHLPYRIHRRSVEHLLPAAEWVAYRSTEQPQDLRLRLSQAKPELVLLLDGVAKFSLRLGERTIETDVPYGDLDGDGIPETPVTRISGPPEEVRRRISAVLRPPARAMILTSTDPRVHWEGRLLAAWFSELGYPLAFAGADPEGVTVRPGSPRPLEIRDGESVAGITCSFAGGWDVPGRHNNEVLEHLRAAHAAHPEGSIHRLLIGARERYIRARPGLEARLRELYVAGSAPDEADAAVVLGWESDGNPAAGLPAAGKPTTPFRRPEAAVLGEEATVWRIPLLALEERDHLPVLKVAFETTMRDRSQATLVVEQDGEPLYRIQAGAETRYARPEPLCAGGSVAGDRYRGCLLLPLRERTRTRLSVSWEGAPPGAARLLPGSAVEIWPYEFERTHVPRPLARPPGEGGLIRRAAE